MKIKDRKSCDNRFSSILINFHRFSSIFIDYIAVLDPEVLFSRVARHLACLDFCKLQVGIFQRSVLFID